MPGQKVEAHISWSKGSHNQKVPPDISAGESFASERALAEVFPGSLGALRREKHRENRLKM